MDSASTGDDRLREIVDRLLASTFIASADRRLLEEAKEILSPGPRPATVTVRHDPHTVPEPLIATCRMPEVGR